MGDDSDPTLAEILGDASGEDIESTASASVRGYAGYGANRRAALQPLVDQFSIPLFDNGERIRTPSASLYNASADELGCDAGDEDQPRMERTQASARTLPKSLALTYYEPSRDYQTGQMRASAAASGGVDEAVELPVAMEADQAKALAESHIARRWAERDRLVLRLSSDHLGIEPGSFVAVEDGSIWRVEQAVIEGMAVKLELFRVADDAESVPADPGRALPAPDVVASPTEIVVLDLPDLGIGRHDVPVLQVAACQPTAGWRPVPIEITSGGEVYTIGSASAEAIIGTALNDIGGGTSVDVELADPEHWLESRDEAALANGANLAALGSELIQYGSAVPIGPKRFRLTNLLRGCRGTEWAMSSHAANESFVLIGAAVLQEIVFPPSAIGSSVSIKPRGLADDEAEPIECVVTGEALRPPSPIDLSAEIAADGAMSLTWMRRSRLGWLWPAGTDVPLGESVEKYRATVQGSAGTLTFEAAEPQMTIPAEALSGMTGTVTISVVQVGDFAESRAATASIVI